MAQEILPPLDPAKIFGGKARSREPGFFSTSVAPGRFGAASGESLEAWMARLNPVMFQRQAPEAIARTSVGMDGAVTVAMDDFTGGGYGPKNLFGLSGGAPVPDVQIGWYASQSFIGYQLCAVMAQHWFIDKACSMPARDAIRNGYDVTRDDGEKLPPQIANEFKKLDKRFKVKKACEEAVRKMRMFGIRIVLFEVNSPDPDYYVKPFNPDGITPGSYKGISQVDPYWITPELDFDAAANPASLHFYEPTYWRINGRRYHRSHLVVLLRNEVPDVLKPTYFYGGIPLPQQLYERCYAAERTANEGPQLALTKRLTVIEGVDMASAVANWDSFMERIQKFAYMRDNYGVQTLGGTETVKQVDTTLNDVDVVIMTQFQLACAIAAVPGTKMMGTQPKGFNATGEYDESCYHEELESIQEHDMEPILARHHLLCMRSFIMPKFKLNEPFETGIAFGELDAETALEHATRTNTEAERDLKWAQAGAIDGIDIRNRLINNKDSGYSGIEEAMPPGPEPRNVVQPGAPTNAPNTPPGTVPANAPPTVAATSPQAASPGAPPPPPAAHPQPTPPPAHDALDAAVARVLRALAAE